MLTVKVFGGLGNQLFQYTFYRYLEQNGNDVYLDISDFDIHDYHHGYELEKVISRDVYEKIKIVHYRRKRNNVILRFINKYSKYRVCFKDEIQEFHRYSFVYPTTINEDIYLAGFWQNVEYVNAVTDTYLKKCITFNKVDDSYNKEFISQCMSSNIIALHVRRGDYQKSVSYADICNTKYYYEAMSIVQQKLSVERFAFFSDDIEWCKNTFGQSEKNIYVDWNYGDQSYLDMYLMSHCKGIVISNSTFSLWAAYLNRNEDKIIVAPKKWCHQYKDNRLIQKDWIIIDNDKDI